MFKITTVSLIIFCALSFPVYANSNIVAGNQSAIATNSSQAIVNSSNGSAVNVSGGSVSGSPINISGDGNVSNSNIALNSGNNNIEIGNISQQLNNITIIRQRLEEINYNYKIFNISFSILLSLSMAFNVVFYFKHKNISKFLSELRGEILSRKQTDSSEIEPE